MRLATFLGTLGCAYLLSSAAFADTVEPEVDLRGYRVPMAHKSGLYLEPAESPDTGEVTAGMRLNYAFRPIILKDATGQRRYSIIEHQLTADVFINVGLFKIFTIGMDLPAVIAQTGDDVSADPTAVALVGAQPVPRNALGDPALVVKATLLKPSKPDAGVALGLLDRLTVPLGDHASFLSEKAVTDEARVLFDGHFLRYFTVHANAGALFRGHTGNYACGTKIDACLTRFGHELLWGGGLELDSKAFGVPELSWFVEARGYLPLSPVKPFDSRAVSGSFASLAARYAIRDVALLAGTELALDSGIGNAPFRITLGVSFAPREHDRDHDGIDDEVDRCPNRPEDKDGFEDEDGCPEAGGDGGACDADSTTTPTTSSDAKPAPAPRETPKSPATLPAFVPPLKAPPLKAPPGDAPVAPPQNLTPQSPSTQSPTPTE